MFHMSFNNKKNSIFHLIDEYLEAQIDIPHSPYNEFIEVFSLTWIMQNLSPEKREEFIRMLEEEKFEEIPFFLEENIIDFEEKILRATREEIKKIKNKINTNKND